MINNTDFKLKIMTAMPTGIVMIYYTRRVQFRMEAMVYEGKNTFKIIQVEEGQPIPAFMEIHSTMAEDFLKQMADELSKKGVVTEDENVTKGKLLATQLHLDDMQRIVDKLFDMNKMTANLAIKPEPIVLPQPSGHLQMKMNIYTKEDVQNILRDAYYDWFNIKEISANVEGAQVQAVRKAMQKLNNYGR